MSFFSSSKPLSCSQGHRFDPLRNWPLPGKEGRLVCPKCAGMLRVSVPRDLAVQERRQEKKLKIKVMLVLIPLFPAVVLLTWLSVSRWAVHELVVSPDGSILAVGRTTIDGGARIQLYNTSGKRELDKVGGEGERIFGGGGEVVRSPIFLPDGKGLVLVQHEVESQPRPGEKGLASYDVVRKWEFGAGKKSAVFKKHTTGISALALDKDAKTLVVASRDRNVLLWDFATGNERGKFSHPEKIQRLAHDPNGQMLATGTIDGRIFLWDLSKAQLHQTIPAHHLLVKGLAFDATGQTLASVGGLDRQAKLWDVRTGAEKSAYSIDLDWLTCVAFAPDGQRIAVGGGSFNDAGQVQIWNLATGQIEQTYRVDSSTVVCIAFTKDGKALLAGSGHTMSIAAWRRQGRLYQWDLESGREWEIDP